MAWRGAGWMNWDKIGRRFFVNDGYGVGVGGGGWMNWDKIGRRFFVKSS